MKQHYGKMTKTLFGMAGLLPATGFSNPEGYGIAAAIPFQMNTTGYMAIAAGLLLATTIYFIFRNRKARGELKDVAGELSQTREHLTQTNQELEKTQTDLKGTTNRYQDILFNAQAGMFQMDPSGKCTYINSAMQKISGLYPKKALKEGIESALHPDDRKVFQKAWTTFVKGNEPFLLRCRFKHSKGFKNSEENDVHVECRISKVFNEKKKIESYIGWVSDITALHEEGMQKEAHTTRYANFINTTVEGYYQLVPKTPIPVTDSAAHMTKAIMEGMILAECNKTFAAMYGTNPSKLKGKSIAALPGGCGPFSDSNSIQKFVAAEYKAIDLESIRQDPRGNRLSLLNNVVGLIEDNKLVGIWGSQRNISQQKREKAELNNQTQFMHRILNALPADVHVKDTSCRYLYASKKVADRTGIPQADWIGKTIFEVVPATSRDHDKSAIAVMKNGKMARTERSYEARGKSGWMETIQIPLVSNDGLVEGVVGLSLEISERKKKEEEAQLLLKQLDKQLKTRTAELGKSEDEHGKTAIALRDTSQKLRIRESELENHENAFKEQIEKRKQTEQQLQRDKETLLTRQNQLEKQLSDRLDLLGKETDKRKKWEELLSIKEDALRKLEKHANEQNKQLKEEIALCKQTQDNLATSQSGLEKYRQELEVLAKEHQEESASLTDRHQKQFQTENGIRQQTEAQLKQTNETLQKTQARLKELIEGHAKELEHEVSERTTATKKLIQSTEELGELKQQFNQRIEEETKTLKHELGERQIREKALRQHEKDMDGRIKELEKMLQGKIKDHDTQIKAREGAEMERLRMEGKLKQLDSRQKEIVERETQKLNLNIAEIRLDEVRLRKEVGDLQQTKENLEKLVETRTAELENTKEEQQKLADTLSSTQTQLEQVSKDQKTFVAQETKTLQSELKQLKKTEHALRKQEEKLKAKSAALEDIIRELSEKLKVETDQREETTNKLNELQTAFDASQNSIGELVEQNSQELSRKVKQHERNEEALKENETTLKKQAKALQQTIDARTDELAKAREEREKAELELMQTIEHSGQGAKEIEATITEIRQEQQEEISRIKEEQKDVYQQEKHYRALFQSSAVAFLQIDPQTGKIQSANLAAANLFDKENTQAMVKKTFQALSPKKQPDDTPSADMAKARLHTALETGQESFEWQFQKSDDATFHALASFSTIDVEEKQVILAIIQDISEIKQRQVELQQAITEAHAANKMGSKIVDEVNEAVQTSLNPIVNSSATIEKAENLSVEQKLDMAVINRNCRSLIDMMNYRCELSHAADGSDKDETGKLDLHELINDLDKQFCQRAATKKLFFAVSYAQYQSSNNVPKFVETDGTKVEKILQILLGYALSQTDKGRIGLHATRKAGKEDTVTTAFELAYTGNSKQDALLARVFGADEIGEDDPEGMKYGLTLARRFVDMLNGEVSLEYRKGDITALSISFPFKKVESEIVMPGSDGEQAAGAA